MYVASSYKAKRYNINALEGDICYLRSKSGGFKSIREQIFILDIAMSVDGNEIKITCRSVMP
jgi:hypothetical protein